MNNTEQIREGLKDIFEETEKANCPDSLAIRNLVNQLLSLLPPPCKKCGGSGITKQQEDGGVAELFCDCPAEEQKLEAFLKKNPDCRPVCKAPVGGEEKFVKRIRDYLKIFQPHGSLTWDSVCAFGHLLEEAANRIEVQARRREQFETGIKDLQETQGDRALDAIPINKN